MSSHDPFEETKEQLRTIFGGGGGGGGHGHEPIQFQFPSWWPKALLAVFVGLGLVTSYYQIEPDETGVVLRFGKHIYNTEPGPHFKLPYGIDRVVKVPVARQLRLEFGFRTARSGVQSQLLRNRVTQAESKMLTVDLNIANLEWAIQFIIKDPEKYLFNFRDIETTLRLMTEAEMRSAVGDFTVDELITDRRAEVEQVAFERLVKLNKIYDTGIIIQQVNLKDVDVPDKVRPALSEVEEAKQDKARLINQAKEERNKVLPRAKGKAKETVAKAGGYAAERVNRAEGDAQRFKAVYEEYRKAKEVTKARLYFESMAKSLPKAKELVLVDDSAKSLVPLLNLGGSKSGSQSAGKK